MKFITDINLGRLALRLRMLGYDTLFYRGKADRAFLRKAQQENRIVLTRKRDLAKREFSGILLVIESDRVENQLTELSENLSVHPEPGLLFSRCLKCNAMLEKVEKEEVISRVPTYVYENHSRFMICPRCRTVYWPGTHVENARKWIRALHIPSHPL